MTFKTTLLVGTLLLGVPLTAMDKTTVKIFDHNSATHKEERLHAAIPHGTLVSVFGATPRYSYFRQYMALINQQLKDLDAAYANNKRLSGVQNRKAVKRIVDRFKQAHPEGSLAEQFNKLSQEDQFRLFFKVGFDRKKLGYNVKDLCTLVAKGGDHRGHYHGLERVKRTTMIHMLLPIYFDDCREYDPSPETLHAFLLAIARFYQGLYDQIADAPEILIYLPPLNYFQELLALAKQGEVSKEAKDELVCRLIKNELFSSKGSPIKESLPVVFINPSVRQLRALKDRLTNEGIDANNILLSKIALELAGKETKSFTPYLLRFDEERKTKTDYKTSPLLTPDALAFITGGNQ